MPTEPEQQQPGTDNADNADEGIPATGTRVWIHTVGWYELPEDVGPGTTHWGYHNGQWFHFTTTETLNPQEPSEHSWQVIGNYAGYASWNDFKEKDGDIPVWDGKMYHGTVYFRKIDLWTSTTGCAPEKRGIKLLQQLTGDAFEKLENVEPDSLRHANGVEMLKRLVVDAYEPKEDFRVGKIMDEFLDGFERKRGQQILDYNLCWEK